MIARPVTFASGGLTLTGELVTPEPLLDDDAAVKAPRAVVLLLHGLPSSGPRDPNDAGYAGLARRIAAEGFAAFWFDFRGTRQAPGDFSIGGWIQDAMSALDAVGRCAEVPAAIPRIIVGSSAGGAVALRVASERRDVTAVATLAAPATFGFTGEQPAALLARFRNAGMIREPSFPADPDAWAREMTENAAERIISSVAPRPLLLVHGEADDVVPYLHAEMLYAAASPPKELARIPGGSHQLRKDERAVCCLLDWLERTARADPSRAGLTVR